MGKASGFGFCDGVLHAFLRAVVDGDVDVGVLGEQEREHAAHDPSPNDADVADLDWC